MPPDSSRRGRLNPPDCNRVNSLRACSTFSRPQRPPEVEALAARGIGRLARHFISTAHAEGAVRSLDLELALVLRARNEPECAFRRLDGDTGGILLIWIVSGLV